MIQLPTTTNGNSSVDVSIEGTVYTLLFNYNTRNKRLYLSILDDEVPIIQGLRLIGELAVLLNYTLPDFADGELLLVHFEEGQNFATLGNTGIDQEYSLVYFSRAEWEA